MNEHDPKTCGCSYLGCDIWSCGHVDNQPEERGKEAYELDCQNRPNYHDGRPRPKWEELSEVARWSWKREGLLHRSQR